MHKKLMWDVAAVAVIELAMMTTIGYPQIAAAKRAQAPQIEKKDVVFDTTHRADRPVARKDDRVRQVLKNPGFKVGLRGARFGEVKVGSGCSHWHCNSPIVDGAAIIARPAR